MCRCLDPCCGRHGEKGGEHEEEEKEEEGGVDVVPVKIGSRLRRRRLAN